MMDHDQFAHHIVSRLTEAGIMHMVSGSIASSYSGEPRATNDIDIVIDATPESLDRSVNALEKGELYVSRDAQRALSCRAGGCSTCWTSQGAGKLILFSAKNDPSSID